MGDPLWMLERGCTRKRAYRTKGEAKAGARRTTTVCRKQYRVYRCLYCGHWHLASKRPSETIAQPSLARNGQ